MNHKTFFISATGTNIGKTCSAALLLYKFPKLNYWKPVQTGNDIDRLNIKNLLINNYNNKKNSNSDIKNLDNTILNKITNLESRLKKETYHFKNPLSPDQASKKEFQNISISNLFNDYNNYSKEAPLIIEGAGGLMVPLFEKYTWIDFIRELKIPIILATSTNLGTINHTNLSIFAIKKNKLNLKGLIFCGPKNNENIESILRFYETPIISNFDFLELSNMENILCKNIF